MDSAAVTLLTRWRHFRTPETDRRRDMTRSIFRFGFPLTLALAVAAMAQAKDQTSDITIQDKPVVARSIALSDFGEVVDRYTFKQAVSYADLDLSTVSGVAELKKRVRETARKDCEEVLQMADPVPGLDEDSECVDKAAAGAMVQVKAAIAAANSGRAGTTKSAG
jgi:UrcA family protein